jgi:glycosyltransferase involved in cell wall biosynthesis
MNPLVSVIVPTYRRPRLLDRCLQALYTQNYPPESYEIIIVDDGPEDGETRALVQDWQQRLQASYAWLASPAVTEIPVTGSQGRMQMEITYQVQSQPTQPPALAYLPAETTSGPAAARNLGWQSARGSIIAFTDDDCIPDPDWLTNGVAAFEQGAAAVSGRMVVPLPPDPTDTDLNTTGLERSDFVTANCFYRRSALEAVGGFDERFGTAWREDSDLYFTLREQRYSLAWAADAVVVHPVRPEPWGGSIRHQRKSFYNALLYKKHPQLYRQFIQPAPPWRYYGMLAAVLIALGGLAAGQIPLSVAGLLAWLFLYARFVWQRLSNTSRKPAHVAEMVFTSLIIPFLSIYWRLRGALYWKVFFF